MMKVRKQFEELEKYPELSSYCRYFYFTMMNSISSYQSISTGIEEHKIKDDAGEKSVAGFVRRALKKGLSYITEFGKNIPILGGVIGIIDSAIGDLYDSYKE